MKNNFAISVLVFLLFTSLLSCGKKTTEPTDEFRVEDFPNSVGFQWTYEVFDSLTAATDTVMVAITDTLTLADTKPATIWVYTYSDTVDTQYVAAFGDTVVTYHNGDTSYLSAMYIFPLEVGKSWRYNEQVESFDMSTVVEKGSISVPAGSFGNSFRTEDRFVSPIIDRFRVYATWLVPGVGIVWGHQVKGSFGGPVVNRTWELLSYDPRSFVPDDFPHSVGFQWTYEVYDGIAVATDTVTVKITDTITIAESTPATIWVYTFSDLVDTQYVAVTGDTVNMYPHNEPSLFRAMYVFPLEVGKRWRYLHTHGVDTCTVIEKDSVILPVGRFQNGFRIETEYVSMIIEEFGLYTTWLVPGVGIVWMHRIEGYLIPEHNKTWELLSYDFTP